ncbi:MAG TPA: DinB family protein [Longimicrobiales bacterium]|nr:DinB family protein [Longimicrobiales bacterium]
MTTELKDPFLRGLTEQVEAVRLDARGLTHGLTTEQMNWQPGPGRWSIAQCLEHVTLTVGLYRERVPAMVAEARARQQASAKPYRAGAMARWLIRSLEPPYRMRVRTMAVVDPPAKQDPAKVIADFDAAHEELERMIASADGVPLDQARATSPFSKLMKMTLGQMLEVNVVHARRHLWQARQVRQQPGFPS